MNFKTKPKPQLVSSTSVYYFSDKQGVPTISLTINEIGAVNPLYSFEYRRCAKNSLIAHRGLFRDKGDMLEAAESYFKANLEKDIPKFKLYG